MVVTQFRKDPAVAVAAAVAFEDLLNEGAHAGIILLGGGGPRGVVEAAAGQFQGQADLADAATGLGAELEDHLADLDGG